MKQQKKIEINWEFLIVFLLFAISLIVRFLLYNTPKCLWIYSDEPRYFWLGASFAKIKGMQMLHFPVAYQKILYSLFLVPSFWFRDIFSTLTSITFTNSLVMNLGIFPLYYIAKSLLKNKIYIFFSLIFYCCFWDLNFIDSFMSEPLFLSLSLLLIYIFIKILNYNNENKKNYFVLCAFAGLLTYALYLTKEISVVFILAYVFFILYKLIKREIKFKSFEIYGVICFILTFSFLYLLFKLTFFSNMGNSYNQQSLDVLFLEGRLEFLICSTLDSETLSL